MTWDSRNHNAAEAATRARALRWFVLAAVLILHWASPQFGQANVEVGEPPDGTLGFSTQERVSQPASLPRSLPRSATVEINLPKQDQGGLSSAGHPDAITNTRVARRLAFGPAPTPSFVRADPQRSFPRPFFARGPPLVKA